MHVTKRDLGVHYLAGTGSLLGGLLVVRALLGAVPLGALFGIVPSLSLASIAYWLPRQRLDDEAIWRIAQWGGFGIAVMTLLCFVLMTLPGTSIGSLLLLSSNVAVGGIGGVLLGGLLVYRDRARTLRQQQSVLSRVLRHDLRNAMSLVRGHAESLEPVVPDSAADHVETITQTADDIVDLSENARKIQRTLDPTHALSSTDVSAILTERVERLRTAYPDARIEADVASDTWVLADERLDIVFDELLENAVEHWTTPSGQDTIDATPHASQREEPALWVSVEESPRRGPDWVLVRIVDDGPGIPDHEVAVHDLDSETPLEHSAGTGLWLVTWLVDRYDGHLSIDRAAESCTVVRVRLRGAPNPSV